MPIVIRLRQCDLKNSALVAAGFNPRALAIKPGTQVHRNRKRAAAIGMGKHRNRKINYE